ncbi:FecR family protein [Dyadobacter sp. CY323]|uniref:FecR family protein n=1 Tax=Dyadobacter sp. CY323 TaxID=2907302 RepID=UPI001F3A070B|nr:FecR family protein [Dyadobacter sp. CY323]MCE6992797.1 FecR family protein [Dyadobacter sp. CY323]
MENKYLSYQCNDFVTDDEFRAWLKGDAPENNHLWETWLAAHPYCRIEAEKARSIILALHFREQNEQTIDTDLQWKRLEAAAIGMDTENLLSIERPKRIFSLFKALAAASVIAVLFFAGYHFMSSRQKVLSMARVEKKTGNGQQLEVSLPDGTIVKLNAGSILSFPKEFNDTLREVTLTGEAFFQVVKNEKSPFVIHTEKVTTRVLGTSFNVSAYPENHQVQIAVVEGKVKVLASEIQSIDKKSVCIMKSEMVTFQKVQGALIVSGYDEKEQIGWKDGILHFEKSDFNATLAKLERWYGVKFQASAKTKMDQTWRFSGKFKDKPLEYVLGVMSYPNQFTFKISDDIVNLDNP